MNRIFYSLTTTATMLLLSCNIALADSANDSFNLGFEQHKTGDLLNAVQCYSNAISKDSTFAMAYQMRGIAWQQLKKYSDAINDYSTMITVGDPSFQVVGYYNRGVVKNMIGDFAGAIPDFSQAIELDQKMGIAFFHRGIAKSKMGDLNGRMEDFRRAARLGDINALQWLNTYYPDWRVPPAPAPPPPPQEQTAPQPASVSKPTVSPT